MTAYRALFPVCALALGACAVSGAPNTPDGGAGDAAGTCEITLALVSQPGPLAPATLQVSAMVQGSVSGIASFDWQVLHDDSQEIPVEPQDPDARQVVIAAVEPGPYRVTVWGQVGATSCATATEVFNVGVPGAQRGLFRLRLVPGPGQPAPPQEQIVEIPGGVDYDLGAVVLSGGVPATGTVRTAAGLALAGYVRATPPGEPGATALETFAGEDGGFVLRTENRAYDILVVPENNAVAPARFAGRLPGDLALSLDPGMAISGAALGPGGAPLAGARVALRIGGVPSTLATTGADGAFSVLARPGTTAHVSVLPATTGLPRLDTAGAGVAMDSGAALTIAYASGLGSRQVAGVRVVDAMGVAAAGARVTWISRPMSAAGSARAGQGTAVELTGSVRAAQQAGPDGALPAIELAEAVYDVVIEPAPDTGDPAAAGAVTVIEIDMAAPAPALLALARPARLSGVVKAADGAPLAGVHITAQPTGALAQAPGATASTRSSVTGAFALEVAGHGSYRLTLAGADARHGRAQLDVQAPGPEQTLALGDIALPATLAVTGRVSLPGTASRAGVTLRLLCYACAGQDPTWPVAEAVSDASGQFTLAVPDPHAAAD